MRTYLLAAILCLALGSHFTAFAGKHQKNDSSVKQEKAKDAKKKAKKKKLKKKKAKLKAEKKKAKKKEKKIERKEKKNEAPKTQAPQAIVTQKKLVGPRTLINPHQRPTPPIKVPETKTQHVSVKKQSEKALSENQKSEAHISSVLSSSSDLHASSSKKSSSSSDSSSKSLSSSRSSSSQKSCSSSMCSCSSMSCSSFDCSSFSDVSSCSSCSCSESSDNEFEIVSSDPEIAVCDLLIERSFEPVLAADTTADSLTENSRIFIVFEDSPDTTSEKNLFLRTSVKTVVDTLVAHPKNFDVFVYGVRRADESSDTNLFDFANVNKYDPTDPEFVTDPFPIATNLDLGLETFVENPDVCYSGFYFGGQTADAFIAGAKQHDYNPTVYPVFYPSVQYIGWYNGPNEVAPLGFAQGGAFGDTFILQ